jgi:hypothetical protein
MRFVVPAVVAGALAFTAGTARADSQPNPVQLGRNVAVSVSEKFAFPF